MADTRSDNGINKKIPYSLYKKGSNMNTFAKQEPNRRFSGSHEVIRNACLRSQMDFDELDVKEDTSNKVIYLDENGFGNITQVGRDFNVNFHQWLRKPNIKSFVDKFKEKKGLSQIHYVKWKNTFIHPVIVTLLLEDLVNIRPDLEPLRERLIWRFDLEIDYGKKAWAIQSGELTEAEYYTVNVDTKTPVQVAENEQVVKNIAQRISELKDPLGLRDSSNYIGYGQNMFIKWLKERGYITKQSFYEGGQSYWHASPKMVEQGYMINNRFKAQNKAEVNQTKVTPKGLAFILNEMDKEDTFVL